MKPGSTASREYNPPGKRIVGWYHSHPRFGIFLSAHDIAIQTVYFGQPWQVAYVTGARVARLPVPPRTDREVHVWR